MLAGVGVAVALIVVAGVVLENLRTTPKVGRIEVNSAPANSPEQIRLSGLKQERVPLDSAGTWKLWPCYELTGNILCPDEWQAFPVTVR